MEVCFSALGHCGDHATILVADLNTAVSRIFPQNVGPRSIGVFYGGLRRRELKGHMVDLGIDTQDKKARHGLGPQPRMDKGEVCALAASPPRATQAIRA